MEIKSTSIEDVLLVLRKFLRTQEVIFMKALIKINFHLSYWCSFVPVQDNQSFTQFGTLRGIHFQINPMSQAKIVRVLMVKYLMSL